ncbi:MAG: hypothetical protein ACRCRP_01565 [Metamycoplasmataceae bacterium]
MKKNIKKNLLGLTTSVAATSVILVPTLLLGLNQESLNLKDKNSKNYVDSAWKDTKIANLGFSPVTWNNSTILPVSYENLYIRGILDIYNYGQTPSTQNPSTSMYIQNNNFNLNLSGTNPLYKPRLNQTATSRGTSSSNLMNIQAVKINSNSLISNNVVYSDIFGEIAKDDALSNATKAIWRNQRNFTSAPEDRLIRVMVRKPFGLADDFAKKAYGSNPPQGLTYVTSLPGGKPQDAGTMPQHYGAVSGGTTVDPTNSPLISMTSRDTSPGKQIVFMLLDLIAYVNVDNSWNFLPNFQNIQPGKPAITKNAIDQSKFDKNLTAKKALEKVINEKTKFLNIDSTNAPKFWDETSTITAQYDDELGKIKINFSVKQDLDLIKKYNDNLYNSDVQGILNTQAFKNMAELNPADGTKLVKPGTHNFTYEISGFKPNILTPDNTYLIEKPGANKNILPSAITNNQTTLSTYVNVYQDNTIVNVFPNGIELVISAQDDILGQAIFSVYNKLTNTVIASITISNFRTINTSKPVTNPITIINDNNYNTTSIKPYNNNWLTGNNATGLSTQSLLNQIFVKQTMIPPVPVPYNNSFLIASANIGRSRHSFISLVSREGEIISSAAFQATSGTRLNIVDVMYDSINKQALAWFVQGKTLYLVTIGLNETNGQLTYKSITPIESYDGSNSASLAIDLAIAQVPNINTTEYWVVHRAIKDNKDLLPTTASLANGSNIWKPLTRVKITNTGTQIQGWDTIKTKFVNAIMGKNILVNPNPDQTSKVFTNKSIFKIHNISSNFINGNEYLGVDMSISFDGVNYEHGNNIHHILFKFSPDPTNPLTSSSVSNDPKWTMEYIYSASVKGFTNSKISDVNLVSTPGSSVMAYNTISNPSQVNDQNKKGWLSSASFYAQEMSYNAITTVLQSSFNTLNPTVISGTTESSSAMNFSIPTSYFLHPSFNNGPQILQQPYWKKQKTDLIIRNSGFNYGDTIDPALPSINDHNPTGKDFLEISYNNLWAPNITSNNGNAQFGSKILATIPTDNKSYYNAINIVKNENRENITSILYYSTENSLQINPSLNDVFDNNAPTQLRLRTIKADNNPIWNTKVIKTAPITLDAKNLISFNDAQNLNQKFKDFIWTNKIFSEYITTLQAPSTLDLVLKGNPVWDASNTSFTVELWFNSYYENGIIKTFSEASSPTISIKLTNVKIELLNVSKANLSKIIFSGNTKNIVISNEDQALVSASNDPKLNQLVKDNVEILYNFDNLSAGTWYTKSDFIVALSNSRKNFFKEDVKNIKIKYSIKPNAGDYTVSDGSEEIVKDSQLTTLIPFIHMDIYYNSLVSAGSSANGIEVVGTDTSNITGIVWPFTLDTEFNKIIAAGIKFQWTNDSTHADAKWVDYNFTAGASNPINIGWNPPYLAVRIIAGSNQVLFDATNYGKPVDVTPKTIKIKLDLTNADLSKIKFTGNTKDLVIATTGMTEYQTYQNLVDIEYSVGWNFDTNQPSNEEITWFSETEFLNKLKSEESWMIILQTGFPSNFANNFKLKSRFKIKSGIPNADRYIFDSATNSTTISIDYATGSESIKDIKNYLNLSADISNSVGTFNIINVLTKGIIKFGNKDSLVNITEVNLPAEITNQLKIYLDTLGLTLKYAFGSENTPPVDSDFKHDWDFNFAVKPAAFPLVNPALYLKFVVVGTTTVLAPGNTDVIKKIEPTIVIPNFIDLNDINLNKVKLSGNSFNNFVIDETEALVGKNTVDNPLVLQFIEIQYNINNIALETGSNKTWFTKEQLAKILPLYTQNIYREDLNNIKAKYSVKPSSLGASIDPNLREITLNGLKVKSYLHVTSYYNDLETKKVQVSGNSSNIGQITFPWDINDPTFVKVLANGVEFQWTTKQTPTDSDWNAYNFTSTTGNPTDIGFPPFLGFRIVVTSSYTSNTEISPNVNNLVNVTPTDLKILINLKSTDLQKITFSGNTKNLVINETGITNFDLYKAIVDIKYSIGWDFTTNTESEIWYTQNELLDNLKNATTWIILKKTGFPTNFVFNFKLKSQFVIKSGIPNENNYIFDDQNATSVSYAYTEAETNTINNYVNLQATTPDSINVVKILTDGIIKFGEKDSFGRITKVILPTEITTQLKDYLDVLNIQIEFAFGTIGTTPTDADFKTNWNTDLTLNPEGFTSSTPALYLRFALKNKTLNTTIIPTIPIIEKSGDKLLLPKFIQLSNDNLDALVFSGSTIALNINEDAALISSEAGQGPTELVKQNIEIVYNFNNKKLDPTKPTEVWFTKAELINLLPTYQENIFISDLDALTAQYRIKQGADPAITIDSPNLPPKVVGTLTSNVKSYIHVETYYNDLLKLPEGIKVSGQNTSNIGNITFPWDIADINFKNILTAGIEFEWTINPPSTTPSKWNKYDFNDPKTHPVDIGWNPPYLAFRISVNTANPRTVIDATIKDKEIDVTPKNIKILISLSEANLQQIIFGGSTKTLTIDESPITNFNSFSSVVELQFSVGWDLDKNIATDQANEIWYSKADLIAKLDKLPKSLFIKRNGYPTELPDTFKLQSRFIIKSGVTNEKRFVFENGLNEVNHTYTNDEKLTIKNYINISALQTKLETAKITFGPQDKPNSISELNIASVSDEEKQLLKILGIQLEFAFGPSATPPDASAYTKNWNDPFGAPVDPGQPPTVWLKFVVISTSETITEIFNSSWSHKAVEPQLEKPKFIQLDEANLLKTALSGSTTSLIIDETLSLVPGGIGNTQDEVTANIEIIYNINNKALDLNRPTEVWFTKTELDTILPKYTNNIFLSDLANITSNYRVKQASADNGWRIPAITPQLLSATNVYSFVHTESYFNILKDKRVKIEGSATKVTNIIFPTDFDKAAFKILQANGIVLQWTTVKTSPLDGDWTDLVLDDLATYPTNIGTNPYLGMRITTNQTRVITSATVNKIVIDVTPLNINIIYDVDSQILINNLIPNGNTKKIADLDETSSLIGQYPDYEHLEIRYKIGTTKSIEFVPGQEWYSFTDLKNQLLNYKKLILPSEKQITAKYFLKAGTPPPNLNPPTTPYISYEINYLNALTEATLNMTNFKSFVDVTDALANLNKNETLFAPGDTTEKITEIIKTGLTNEEADLLFGLNLDLRGDLATELTSPNFAYWWQPGKNANLPKNLPNKDQNGKPVLMWRFALTTITDITFNADDNAAVVSDSVQLNVSLPIQININSTDYDTIKAAIGGNTKNLELAEAIEAAAITTIKTRENLPQDIPLQILYAIGGGTSLEGLPIDETNPTKTWFTLTEFKTLLAAKTVDFNTNQIRAKFYIDPSYSNAGQKYVLSTEIPETLQAEEFSDAAKVKIFINKANYETLPAEITIVGSSDDLTITIPDGLKTSPNGTLSPGLELVWSIQANPQLSDITQTDNSIWTSVVPTMIDPVTKKLSVAYRVKPGYLLETSANKIYAIDTSKIFVYINVENAWLDQIAFTGNLFEATIDEATFNNNLTTLPGGEWIQIQYTVDEREWLLKDAFIAKLKQLEGSLDANNFILLKNKIKARYSIDPAKFTEYRLKVDGVAINDKPFVENPALFRQILSAATNVGFNGYINLSKVPDFNTNGFRITGTNTVPILEFTSAGEKLKAQFAPYQNQAISPFDIYYTVDKGTGNGNFTLDDNHKLFGATGFKTTGFDQISTNVANQFFGIKIVARAGYQIFKNNVLQNDGWSFSIPLNIKTIKPNPFGTNKLVVKFEGYQGLGVSSLWFDGATPPELASSVINKDPDLVNEYYVEFYVSDTTLTQDEINKIPQENWIRVGAPDGQGGTVKPPSNLRVGQFVIGRIRMKESSTFEIKDIKLNDSILTKVTNLLIKQSDIKINTPQLKNNEYSNQTELIDGDIYINKVDIEKDANGNYLGADLVLQVQTEFYKRADGSFVLDNNGLPIVKRIPTAFYDVFGPVTGSPSTEVRIYYTDSSKTTPTDPLETGTPTDLNLTEVPDSLATFIYDLNSGSINAKQGILFQNQTFTIKIKVKKDFVFDNSVAIPFVSKITNAKYPLNVNNNITMSVQIPDPIKYETTGELTPQNGKAFITSDTDIQIQFIEDNGNISNTLKGEAAYNRLLQESNGKLRIRVTLKRKSSEDNFFYNGTNLNLSQLQDLSNGDRILISLVPIDPNFILIGASSSIASWTVNSLEIAPPNIDIFKDLKIVTNINGSNSIWDGQGTFFVAVKTGNGNPPEDLSDELLNPNNAAPGQTRFHFVYRVWGVDKKVRINWTPDKKRISSLKNGEKIEWRLKSQSDEPLTIDYFNTVAHNSAEKKFAVINVDSTGLATYDSQFGIEGNENKYVEGTEIYPENQGFTVSGLVESEIVLEGNLLQNIESIKLSFTGTNGAGIFSINNPAIAEELLAQGIIISWYRNGQLISPDQSIAMLSNGDVITYKLSTTSSTVVIKNNITNSFIVSGLIESSNFVATIATTIGVSVGILTVLIVAAPLIYRKLIKNKLEGKFSK